MQVCPGCSTKNRESARFCDQCGTRLLQSAVPSARSYTPKHLAEQILKSRATLMGERKHVTVLFADIKGSTPLAEKVGAEAWHEILNRFFTILANAVHRYEGTVNQYTGDGIMALFGAPIAHEDHAHRAALAALEMQREVRLFSAELQESDHLVLGMRVGLNTGEVVVGTIGDDLRMDYTAKGLTVNLAARMEQMCQPGCIYVSRYSAAEIENDFVLRDLGEREVAGSSHPIRMFELQGERTDRARQSRQFSRSGQAFAGRDSELQALKQALEKVSAGSGRIVSISGEAGIGKSRLCHEFALYCRRQSVPVHQSAGVAYSSAMPLLPVRMLLRSRLGIVDQADATEIHRRVGEGFTSRNPQKSAVLPMIADFLGAGGGSEESSGLRSLMIERIARYLPRSEVPHVLLVEDLHYADTATEDFLTRLCEQIAGTRTLLLLNHRSDYPGRWFVPYLDDQITLRGLPKKHLESIASELLGPARKLVPVAEHIAQRAGGNPFFVEEAVQALAEAGYLWGTPGNYAQSRVIDEWPIPHSVQALIAGRIDRLPEQQKILLQAAAVVGRSFDSQLVQAATGSETYEHDLMALTDLGFLQDLGNGQFMFRHALTQDVAYHSQLDAQRAQTHAAVAAALEARCPLDAPATELALQLARHWTQAEVWHKAGVWNLQAARWCAPRDLTQTLAQFRLAITNLDRADYSFETMRMRIAARAGLIRMAQYVALDRAEVEQAYHDAWKMTEEFSDIEGGAELLFSYGAELLHRGQAEKAAELVAQAVSDAQAVGCQILLRRFRFVILMTHNAAGRLQQGLKLANAGGESWLQRALDAGNFIARGFYGEMLMWQGNLSLARENLQASVDYSERENREAIWQLAALVDWAWFSGERGQAMAHAQLAQQRTQLYGSTFFKAFALRALGLAQILAGQHGEAIATLEQGLPYVTDGASGHPLQGNYLAVLAEAYAGAGRMNEARQTAEEAILSAQNAGARIWELRAWSIYLQLEGPRAAEGIERTRSLMELTGAEAFRPWWVLARSLLESDPTARDTLQREASAAFAHIGAHAHAQRLPSTWRTV